MAFCRKGELGRAGAGVVARDQGGRRPRRSGRRCTWWWSASPRRSPAPRGPLASRGWQRCLSGPPPFRPRRLQRRGDGFQVAEPAATDWSASSTQTILVFGVIAASMAERSARSTKLNSRAAERLRHLVEQPETSRRRGSSLAITWSPAVQGLQQGGDRRQPGGEGVALGPALQVGPARATRANRVGVSGCGCTRTPGARRGSIAHRSRVA